MDIEKFVKKSLEPLINRLVGIKNQQNIKSLIYNIHSN